MNGTHRNPGTALALRIESPNSEEIRAAYGELEQTINRIDLVAQLSNLTTEVTPSSATIVAARSFIERLHHLLASASHPWKTPHVSAENDGGIAFEWWRQEKILTFFVLGPDSLEYLKVWGPHIWNEMEEGESPSDKQLLALWEWLTQPDKNITR